MIEPDYSAIALAGKVYDASNPGSDVSAEVRLFTKLMMARAIAAERHRCWIVVDNLSWNCPKEDDEAVTKFATEAIECIWRGDAS